MRVQTLMIFCLLLTVPALAGCAQPSSDADTLDGLDSTDFALSDQACDSDEFMTGIDDDGEATCGEDQVGGGTTAGDFALADQACAVGQVVRAIAADGTLICTDDQTGGGDADTLDGNDASDFLGSDASVVHRMSVSPTQLWHSGATQGTGFGPNWGLQMPEGSSSNFQYAFILPDTYTTGDPVTITVIGWMDNDSDCDVNLRPNSVSFTRPGMVPTTNGGGASTGLSGVTDGSIFSMPATENEATTKEYALDWDEGPEPGDLLAFNLFRSPGSAADTCTGEFHVGGLEITWQ